MADEVKTWRDVAEDIDDFMLDIRISNFAPINPKPQYDLAFSGYNSALIGLKQSPDRLRYAKRARALGSRLSELTELVYGRSAHPEVLRSNASQIFSDAQSQFDEATKRFRAQATIENAEVVRELGAWCLEAVRSVFTRPSPQYQKLFERVLDSLIEVADYARRQ
jgi:hypothetical protein